MFHFLELKYCLKSFSQECRVSRYFTEANSRKGSKQVVNSKKMVIFTIGCCSLQYSHMNEMLKPKGETNRSFLVLHPSSGEGTVNTVGSHLKGATSRFAQFKGLASMFQIRRL